MPPSAFANPCPTHACTHTQQKQYSAACKLATSKLHNEVLWKKPMKPS